MKVVEEEQRKETDGEQEEMTTSGDTFGSAAGLTATLSYKGHCCPSKLILKMPQTHISFCVGRIYLLWNHISAPTNVVKSKKANAATPWCNTRVPKTG